MKLISFLFSKMKISNLEELDNYISIYSPLENYEKGKKFEEICKHLLYKYFHSESILSIDYYSEIMHKQDKGVDLVITHKNNKKSYVQVKYRKDSNIDYRDISTFISEVSNKERAPNLEYVILITNSKANKEVRKYFEEKGNKWKIIQDNEFENLLRTFNVYINDDKVIVKKFEDNITLRSDQEDAFVKMLEYYDSGKKRGLIFCPTGWGKTVIIHMSSSLFLEKGRIHIIVLPLISLLHQTRRKLAYKINGFEDLFSR
jgi:predicted helicase